MSEFKFLCPACGQKIACDSSLTGTQIACPSCQGTLTIPAAAPVETAGVGASVASAGAARPAPPPVTHTAQPPPVSARAAAKPAATESSRYSGLAIASLLCSVFAVFGFIPGLIFGHMAKARMRKDVFLEGEKMANAGLAISYCMAIATLLCGFAWLGTRWHFHGHRIVRDSPDIAAAPAYRVVDQVIIDQTEEDHDFVGQGQTSKTTAKGQAGRLSQRGSFSYTMKVLPHELMTLSCRYWGSERAGRLFDIAIDERIIATQKLNNNAPEKFFDVEYKIPAELTRGKDQVTVEFQARPSSIAGTLFGVEMLKR